MSKGLFAKLTNRTLCDGEGSLRVAINIISEIFVDSLNDEKTLPGMPFLETRFPGSCDTMTQSISNLSRSNSRIPAQRAPVAAVIGKTKAILPPILTFSSARTIKAEPSPAYMLAGVENRVSRKAFTIIFSSFLLGNAPKIGFHSSLASSPGPPALVYGGLAITISVSGGKTISVWPTSPEPATKYPSTVSGYRPKRMALPREGEFLSMSRLPSRGPYSSTP